jgi:flavodoxin
MKSLPSVCALGGIVIIVTKRHEEVSAKASDKRFRASVQCSAYLMVKSTRYDRLVIRSVGLGMKAIIIYHTRFGNTERIAKSLEIGLKEATDIQDVVCINVRDGVTDIDSLKEYDIICIGAPTEGFSAPKPIKQFLTKLKGVNLAGKYGFAFDTTVDSRLSGSAAKFIEKELKKQGLQIVSPVESAIVFALKEMGTITDARLKEGEEKRFEQVGLQLGTTSVQNRSNILDMGQ